MKAGRILRNMAPTIEIKIDAELICRGCLSSGQSLEEMFTLFNETETVPESLACLYIKCTALPLDRSDKVSEFLCRDCHAKLLAFQQFRTVCIDSYKYLYNIQVENEGSKDCNSDNENDVPINVKTEKPESESKNEDCRYEETIYLQDEGDASSYFHISQMSETDENDEKTQDLSPDDVESTKCHRITDDDERVKLICDICQKPFFKKHRLEGHMREHMGLKQWDCNQCDKSYVKWHTYKTHMSYWHGDDTNKVQYKCDYDGCNKSYPMKVSNRCENKTYLYNSLTKCDVLILQSSLKIHIKNKHMGQPIETVATFNFVCEHCGKSFKSNSALKKHTYTHLPNLMPFKCKICPKKYPTKHKLKEHIMRHEGIKNYVCTLCGLRKTTGHELKVHMNYHTRDKQFPCELCTRVFSNIGNRSRHIKIVHCGVKEFKCTYCEKSFGKAETLKHHIMTHTGLLFSSDMPMRFCLF